MQGTYTTEGKTDTATVTVTYGTATTLDITPKTKSVRAGETVLYTAKATDVKGNTWDVTDSTIFGVNDPNGSMATNTYTAGRVGTWTVRGTYTTEGKTDTATVTVTYGTATTLDITPSNALVWVLDTVTYSATARDMRGNTWTVTGSTTFGVNDLLGTMSKNIYTAGEKGTWTITGTYTTAIGSTTVRAKVRPNLWVIKLGEEEVRQGDSMDYYIYYGNEGCSQAGSVTLKDILPPGVSFVSSSLWTYDSITGSGTAISPHILTWNLAPIQSQGEDFATITVQVGSTVVGELTNVAEIATSVPDSECNFEYNRATFTTVANIRMIDLSVSKLSVPEVLQGAILTYTITYNNLGNIEASNVTLTDYLPEGVSYISNTLGTPTISNNSKTLVWSIGSIPAKGMVKFDLLVKVSDTAFGNITNVISIHGTKTEQNLSNNQATCMTVVKPSKVDLSIEKQGPAMAKPNSQIRYLISYQNKSNVTATGVTITDILPSNTSYATSTLGIPTTTSQTGGTLTWSISSLSAQGSGYFELLVNIGTITGTTTLTNTISISSTQQDVNLADNQSIATTTVIPERVDLEIQKWGPQTIYIDSEFSYTIQYRNLENAGLVKATITDTLPTGITFVRSSLGTPTTQNGNICSWVVDVSQATSFATITVSLGTVAVGTSLTNHIAIAYIGDINSSNNIATWTSTTDEALTDVLISKYGSWQTTPGGKILYKFWINNVGETPITGTITDFLPIGLTYVTNTNQDMVGTPAISTRETQIVGTVPGEGVNLTWTIRQQLPAGSCTMTEVLLDVCPFISLYRTTHAASPTLGYSNEYIVNKIRVETIPMDNNMENNEDDFVTQILSGKADVYVYKRGHYEACPGQVIKYYVYGGNYGYSDAGSVTLTDTMPIGVTIQGIEYLGGIRIGSPTMATITNGKWQQQVLTWNNIGTISAPNGIYSSTIPDIPTNWFYFAVTAKIPDDILPTGWTSINLDNAISISTTSHEEGLYLNSMNVKTIVIPQQVDLAVYKWGPSDCAAGNEIVYGIGYYNNGPDIAHTVTITDTLPIGVEYGTDTSGLHLQVVGSPSSGQKLIWTVGTLSSYSANWMNYKHFNLTVKIGTLTVNTKLTNKVEIWSKDKEKDSKNNKAEWVTTVRYPNVDLTIYKSGPKEVIRGNNDIWYYIWFYNKGNTTANDVKPVDTLPSGANYKNYYGYYYDSTYTNYQRIGTPTVSANKQIITWNLGDLPSDSRGYITIMVTANTVDYSDNKIYNKVSISSKQHDGNPNNNYAECSSKIINPVTNLHVIKHGPKKVSPGNEMIYTIHYGNAGNAEVRDIEIVDTLPEGVTYMGSDIDFKYPPRILGNKVIWRVPKIRHGFNTNFDVKTLLAGSISAGTVLKNKVEITNLPTDNNWKNNVSEWKTKVVKKEPDIAVTISGDIASPGFKKNLYVTCSNEGTGLAENVVLTLRLPDKNHVTHDYSRPEGDYNSSKNTIIWSIGSLLPKESRHYRAKIMVKTSTGRGTRLYSQATVSTTSKESDYKNNKAEEHEDVIASYDPNMKTASPQDYVPATATDISYTIHFENIGQANATKIKLDDQLSNNLDWSTVEIENVCIGGTVSTISEFNKQLQTRLRAKLDQLIHSQYTQDEVDEIVEMSGLKVWWHPSVGTITWEIDFGDYEFGLPPNDDTDAGSGWVSFKVSTIGTLSSGTEIINDALITFDYNVPIKTPVVKHVVDGTAPTTQIILDPYQVGSTFTVGWSGNDTVGKIAGYEIYSAQDNGTPTLLGNFVENSSIYVGIVGHTYTFYCKAMDMAGNVSSTSTAATRVLSVAEAGAGTMTQVIINPASNSIELGETMRLTACGLNENGEALMVGISYSWNVPGGLSIIGSTTNSITVKGAGVGTQCVSVTAVTNAASKTSNGTYTVSAGVIDSITIAGTPTSMELNQQALFVGHAWNRFGAEITGQTFDWKVMDTVVGSITLAGTTSTSATVTAKIVGSGYLVATANEKQGSLQISVSAGSVATVTVDGPTTLQLGQTAVFTAKAYNQSGHELLDKIATWEVSPAPPFCNFTPSSISSAILMAQAPGIGTLTGNIEEIRKACAITIIEGTVTQLSITTGSQTMPAGMVSSAIVIEAQNSNDVTVSTPATITLTVTSDSSLSRFSQSASEAEWTGTGTFVIPAGANSTSIFHKYNGTATAAITITVNANGSITAATHNITITALGTSTVGNIVADDGKTMVTLKANDLSGASFIEINTSPTQPGVNAPNGLVMVPSTLREIRLSGAGLNAGATVTVTIPYTEANIGGNDENNLQLYQLGSGSTTWSMVTNINRDQTSNTIAGVVHIFSHFVLMLPTWKQTLNEVIVYPNPCITDKHGYQMHFTNLTQNAVIKIFNIAGELVKEIRSNNPLEIWKIDNDDGERVASGIYIYLITDTANNKKIGKLAVIK